MLLTPHFLAEIQRDLYKIEENRVALLAESNSRDFENKLGLFLLLMSSGCTNIITVIALVMKIKYHSQCV